MNTKMILLIACVAFSAAGMAQTTFGVRAGVNFQNLNGEDGEGDKLENRLMTGFHAGVNVEIPVADEFYVQPGLLFSTKGARTAESIGDEDLKVKLSYLEIPINFLYKPVLGQGKLLVGIGPYFAFGVGGKMKLGDQEESIEFEKEISAAQAVSGQPYFKRFDAGGNLLFGYEFSNNFSAQLNAQLGLVNINPQIEGIDDDTKVRNTGFGISLGYRF